jgi:hypothetical protein
MRRTNACQNEIFEYENNRICKKAQPKGLILEVIDMGLRNRKGGGREQNGKQSGP